MTATDALQTYHGQLAVLVEPAFQSGRGRGILFAEAGQVTDDDVRIMAMRGRGICTVTINEKTAMRLGLKWQGPPTSGSDAPYYATSVESKDCTETGISARERAITMRALGKPDLAAADLHSPGHIMVQVAVNILREGASLPELANLLVSARTAKRFAGWSDILDDDGEVASADYCRGLAAELGLDVFQADAVIAVGRAELADWVHATEFSKARFDSV